MAKKREMAVKRGTSVVTVGDTSNRETYESGGATLRDSVTWRVVVKGLYDEVKAAAPARGGTWAGYTGYLVDAVNLTRMQGGVARMEIDLVPSPGWAGIASTTVLRERWEIDMAQIEKPILTHPTISEGTEAEHIGLWREATAAQRANWKYTDSTGEQTLTATEITWAKKILKGVEGYLVFAPVITRIREYEGRPETDACGTIGSPTVSVSGYEYLKTADRSVQNDKKSWTRTEQWTGADEWDTDLYGAS